MKLPDNLAIFASPAELQQRATDMLCGIIRETLQKKPFCRLGLTGGTTPGPVYRMLADPQRTGQLPLERIQLLFGDERCVPPDDEESNYRLAREAFGSALERFNAVFRMEGECSDSVAAAAAYERHLEEPIDILLLGMGPDAHVASIFPDSMTFAHRSARAMAVEGPKPPPRRITVTPPVIQSARHLLLMVTGSEKAAAVWDVFHKPLDPPRRPAQLALRGIWLLDRSAASVLTDCASSVRLA